MLTMISAGLWDSQLGNSAMPVMFPMVMSIGAVMGLPGNDNVFFVLISLAAAHSRAVDRMSKDIAATVQKLRIRDT